MFLLGGLGARIYGMHTGCKRAGERKNNFLVGRRLFIEDGAAMVASSYTRPIIYVHVYIYTYLAYVCIYILSAYRNLPQGTSTVAASVMSALLFCTVLILVWELVIVQPAAILAQVYFRVAICDVGRSTPAAPTFPGAGKIPGTSTELCLLV